MKDTYHGIMSDRWCRMYKLEKRDLQGYAALKERGDISAGSVDRKGQCGIQVGGKVI